MSNKISILGIGWLGLPLAMHLIAKEYQIKGSTTSLMKLKKLKQKGIKPYHIILKEDKVAGGIDEFFDESEILIINIPPGLRSNPDIDFVAKIRGLLKPIEKSSVKHVLFVSSTSVFEDQEGFPIIQDTTVPNASKNSGEQLIATEWLLRENANFKTTILRFGGLFGPDRHPATMLSGKTNLKNPEAPINLIHQQDCIEIIDTILEQQYWEQTLNAAYADHPQKEAYYTTICKQMNLPIPQYDKETVSIGKAIDPDKAVKELNYEFKKDLYTI